MNLIVEANSQAEQDLAFTNGALIVIRTDLIPAPTPTPTPTGTTRLLLHFDDASYSDSSSYTRAVTKVSSPILSTPSKFGANCVNLASGYLTVQDSDTLRFGDSDWTIECWHKVKTVDGNHDFICSKGASGNLNQAWYFGILNGSNIAFVPKNNSSLIYEAYPYYNDTTNFHHLSLNRAGTKLNLYIDGVLFKSVDYVAPYEGTGALYVGGWNYTTANVSSSYIDEFIINIGSSLRTSNFTPPTSPFGA